MLFTVPSRPRTRSWSRRPFSRSASPLRRRLPTRLLRVTPARRLVNSFSFTRGIVMKPTNHTSTSYGDVVVTLTIFRD